MLRSAARTSDQLTSFAPNHGLRKRRSARLPRHLETMALNTRALGQASASPLGLRALNTYLIHGEAWSRRPDGVGGRCGAPASSCRWNSSTMVSLQPAGSEQLLLSSRDDRVNNERRTPTHLPGRRA